MNSLRNVCPVLLWLLACGQALAGGPGWKLGFDGLGPIKVGMRFPQVNKLLGNRLVRTPPELLGTAGCESIPLDDSAEMLLMFVDDVLKRVDVAGDAATDRGIRRGDPVARVLAAYPSAARQPDSDDGLYLTAMSPDGKRAIRFATFRGRVQLFYAGEFEQVQYTEGCL